MKATGTKLIIDKKIILIVLNFRIGELGKIILIECKALLKK